MHSEMAQLVDAWLQRPDQPFDPEDSESFTSAFDIVFEMMRTSPDSGWSFIVEASNRELTPSRASRLAAGPLEDLLTHHGLAIINQVEQQALASPAFRNLLSGVWQGSMPNDLWQRIQAASTTVPQSRRPNP
ncbi:DUF6869 domain-containing protein [Geothrix oryzisoli]|uniref:DUF6869 domain-containing protein n=1 Tax=Geothrix oryzisoli TaxID=2922721 RepID=UPI003B848BA5